MENTPDQDGILITEKHVFFYKNICPFSNFYKPSPFKYSYFSDVRNFFCSEQAFMWHKAKYFGDISTANKIIEETDSPMNCKNLGRTVSNYDDNVWDKIRYAVMLNVNIQKFSQIKQLTDFILQDKFEGKTFVEASPYDTIWGIGMKIGTEGIDDENNWKGKNLLGKCITEVRSILKGKIQWSPTH